MRKLFAIGAGLLLTAALSAQPRHMMGERGHGFGGGPFGMMAAGPMWGPPVTGAPYSAVQNVQFQDTLANGNQINHAQQIKVYRDSQGRVRVDRTFTPPGAATARNSSVIFDPVAGFIYVLNPAKQTAVKRSVPTPPANGENPPRHRTPRGATVTTDDLGTQAVNGLPATGTRTTTTIPAGAIGNTEPIQIVRETWVSTDLKIPVEIKTTNPMFGNTVMDLTNIVRSEPDASLFQVPSNYTVTTRQGGMGMGRGMGRKGPGL